MTEKQLREGLQDYLASAGLPDKRREALLAAVRAEAPPPPMKGEPNMFRPNKFRTALIAAAIVTLLTFTVALAAGFSGFVNIRGEKMDMSGMLMARPTPEPSPLTATDEPETDYFALVNDILLNAPTEYLVTASYQEDGIHHSNGIAQGHIVGGNLFHGTDDIGQLAYTGRFDDNPVGMVLIYDLGQSLAEITHQTAADAAGVHFGNIDTRVLEETAIDADLTKFIFDKN